MADDEFIFGHVRKIQKGNSSTERDLKRLKDCCCVRGQIGEEVHGRVDHSRCENEGTQTLQDFG
jgi:hypothetical protein